MPPFADQLARLRVAVETGNLPSDLGAWVVAELSARARGTERRELRDQLLATAARLLLPDGSTWARAGALQTEITSLDRRAGALSIARQLVAEALEVDPGTPRSHRQLHTILKSTPFRFQTDPAEGRR